LSVLLLAACGGGGGDAPPPQTPPDLSGVWAGAWQGVDPNLGLVTGTWEVAITQGDSSASGPSVLLGDVDCMDGQMQTDPANPNVVTGTLGRLPCASVSWTLTALNVSAGTAGGSWTNSGTGGGGTLSGDRIARLTGPRIFHMHPPGGRPGALVTLVGKELDAAPVGVLFNGAAQPTATVQASRIVARVPFTASTGRIEVTTAAGSARSPIVFSTTVGAPPTVAGAPDELRLAGRRARSEPRRAQGLRRRPRRGRGAGGARREQDPAQFAGPGGRGAAQRGGEPRRQAHLRRGPGRRRVGHGRRARRPARHHPARDDRRPGSR
jgi:hypothetical protein